MRCDGCGNESAHHLRVRKNSCICDRCGGFTSVRFSDVYFREPYLDPNLVSQKHHENPDGVWVRSREHKAALLKEQGLRELGDRRHGAINYDPKIRH